MRRLLSGITVSGALWLVAAAAGAATLNWEGTSNIALGTTPPTITTGTGVATVNGSGGLGHLNTLRLAGGITGSQMVPLTDPNTPEVATLFVTGMQGTGTLKPISAGGPLTLNTLPIEGQSKLCLLFAGCNAWLDIPLTQNGTRGLGIGGQIVINGFGAGVRISVNGAPWTVATAMLVGAFTTNAMLPPASRATENRTFSGFAHGPASASSTANIGGVIQLVSASFVDTTLMTPSNHIALRAFTSLEFVPEPGLVLLLASGVVGLALLGRSRMRR